MKYLSLRPILATLILCMPQLFSATANAADERIDEIVVTADFRARAFADVPASVTVLDAATLATGATQHFEELLDRVPNLNWSGDGHRARHLQIRGVGELEQYQGAPNPSIGFLIDDIDFSGIGGIATLFDIESVDVLRGAQGLRYGANALGGLVYMKSVRPTAARSARVLVSAGDDDLLSYGAAVGGAINSDETLTGRISAQKTTADGFRRNPFLNRRDTNGRDESTVRGRIRYAANEDFVADMTLLYIDTNNGYDAFALDNSYTVLSDNPGQDAQKSVGASLRLDWAFANGFSLTSVSALADSEIEFGFDADWGNSSSWSPFVYDYESSSLRERKTLSQEFRLLKDKWLIGFYAQDLREDLSTQDRGDYFDPFFNFTDALAFSFSSNYESTNIAVFADREFTLNDSLVLSTGVRFERRNTDYGDSNGLMASPSESMWGGEVSLRYKFDNNATWYTTLSKGYKAGGFNLGATPPGKRDFGGEDMLTLETGLKATASDGRLRWTVAVFASERDDQQSRTSTQLIAGDPASFVFFTDNVENGDSLGLESELTWLITDAFSSYLNVGLLRGRFASGRDQAHAPRLNLAGGLSYESQAGFFARLDATFKGSYYFDVSHDQKSDDYALLHGRLGFRAESWTVSAWVRNIFDENYAVRGFFFGNEPPDFPNTLYTRLGDPRHIGVTLEKRF